LTSAINSAPLRSVLQKNLQALCVYNTYKIKIIPLSVKKKDNALLLICVGMRDSDRRFVDDCNEYDGVRLKPHVHPSFSPKKQLFFQYV